MLIVLYSADNCVYCNKLKKYLEKRGILYNEYNVEKNNDKFREMFKKSKQQEVPVLDIDGKIIIGFDKTKLKRILYN